MAVVELLPVYGCVCVGVWMCVWVLGGGCQPRQRRSFVASSVGELCPQNMTWGKSKS